MSDDQKQEKPLIAVPQMCYPHRYDLIRKQLGIPASGAWFAAEITASVGLFQAACADGRVWKRAEGDAKNLSLVLAEIGCLACYLPLAYERVVALLKKGTAHAAKVVRREITDHDWPYLTERPGKPEA